MDDRAARELIFRAGFSTAAQVSEVSGRGVGMDAVRQTIVARLKGTIEIESTPGRGSAFVLELPLTSRSSRSSSRAPAARRSRSRSTSCGACSPSIPTPSS